MKLTLPESSLAIHQLSTVPEELLWRANFNSDQTVETYDVSVKQFGAFLGIQKSEELRTVGRAHVLAFRRFLQEQGKSNATINTRLSALSSFYAHLMESQLIRENPVSGVKRMKDQYSTVKTKCLTKEEARRMLDCPDVSTLKGLRDRAILHTLFYMGGRVSEIAKLKVRDYFEERGYWILDMQLKGGRRNRQPVHPELKQALEDYLAVSGHQYLPDSPMFLPVKMWKKTESPQNLTRLTLSLIWHHYEKLAGISGTSCHSSRTTFITEALNNQVPIDAVQRTVGHQSIRTTQKYDQRESKYKDSATLAVRF